MRINEIVNRTYAKLGLLIAIGLILASAWMLWRSVGQERQRIADYELEMGAATPRFRTVLQPRILQPPPPAEEIITKTLDIEVPKDIQPWKQGLSAHYSIAVACGYQTQQQFVEILKDTRLYLPVPQLGDYLRDWGTVTVHARAYLSDLTRDIDRGYRLIVGLYAPEYSGHYAVLSGYRENDNGEPRAWQLIDAVWGIKEPAGKAWMPHEEFERRWSTFMPPLDTSRPRTYIRFRPATLSPPLELAESREVRP